MVVRFVLVHDFFVRLKKIRGVHPCSLGPQPIPPAHVRGVSQSAPTQTSVAKKLKLAQGKERKRVPPPSLQRTLKAVVVRCLDSPLHTSCLLQSRCHQQVQGAVSGAQAATALVKLQRKPSKQGRPVFSWRSLKRRSRQRSEQAIFGQHQIVAKDIEYQKLCVQ